ncbi:MAG: hypothetical protein H6581_07200 [Bacteroidia bacterium]|nr:hypothetical protein [Bacteroidia bacterium]
MLLKLAYSIQDDPELNQVLLPVIFNEEEYSISKLYKMWEKVAEILSDKEPGFSNLHDEMDDLYDKLKDEELYEKAAFELLIQRARKEDKKLILFIDNFGDIFSKFDKHENQRLREVLTTCADLRLIAASSVVMEAFFDYKEPLFEFFKREKLQGLSRKEADALLLKLGEDYKQEQIKTILEEQPGRVEALRRITGGVIRTMVLMFEIFVDYEKGEAFEDLEKILDRVTPLYKHRMDDLPAQQQTIVNVIALQWDAISTKEIAEKTRLASKVVSAQLSQLVDNDIVEKVPTNTKNHLYRIKERFFNIWYLMRQGRRNDKQRVVWLTRFFEDWCDEIGIVDRARKHVEALKGGLYDVMAGLDLSLALSSAKHLPTEERSELVFETLKFLKSKSPDLLKSYSRSEFDGEQDLNLLSRVMLKQYQENKTAFDGMNPLEKKQLFVNMALLSLEEDNQEIATELIWRLSDGNSKRYFILLSGLFIKTKRWEILFELGIMAASQSQKIVAFMVAQVLYGVEKDMALHLMTSLANNEFWPALFFQIMNFEGTKTDIKNLYETEFNSSLKYVYINQKFIQSLNPQKNTTDLLNSIGSELISQWLAKLIKFDFFEEAKSEIIETERRGLLNLDDVFLQLLAKKEFSQLANFFTSPQGEALHLKDRFKPIWYALMYYMQDEYPNEYLKMGPELEETVKEIIAEVEKRAVDYA